MHTVQAMYARCFVCCFDSLADGRFVVRISKDGGGFTLDPRRLKLCLDGGGGGRESWVPSLGDSQLSDPIVVPLMVV